MPYQMEFHIATKPPNNHDEEYREFIHSNTGKKLLSYISEYSGIHRLTISEIDQAIEVNFNTYLKQKKYYAKTNKVKQVDCFYFVDKYPEIFNVLDVIHIKDYWNKHFFIVTETNQEEVKGIIQENVLLYKEIFTEINKLKLSIFVVVTGIHHNDFTSNTYDEIGKTILEEIDDRRIKVGHLSCSNDKIRIGKNEFVISKNFVDSGKRFNNITGYRSDIGKSFRSTWEANIARILTHQKLPWSYEPCIEVVGEPKEFLNYMPDFYIPPGIVIEVKGYWDYYSRIKIKVFEKYKPGIELILIDYDLYYDIARVYQDLIPNWEGGLIRSKSDLVQVKGIMFTKGDNPLHYIDPSIPFFLTKENKHTKYPYEFSVRLENGQLAGYVTEDWNPILSRKLALGYEYKGYIKRFRGDYFDLKLIRSNFDKIILPELFQATI